MTPETTADLERGGTVAVDLPDFDVVLVLVDGHHPVLAKLQGVIRDADGRLVPLYDGGAR